MKILIRNRETKQWQPVDPRNYADEKQLEAQLLDSPDLLPAAEGQQALFFQSQVPVGQNAVDLVGVSANGSITLVECKLESNREARREVVAQILEYAAQMWGMDYEEFDALLSKDTQRSLVDLVRGRAPRDWSEEAFRAGVERALGVGDFRLVIAVSGVTGELKRILEYVNSRGGVHLEALELRYFSDGIEEVLVPEVHGARAIVQTQSGRGRPPRRNLEEVYAAAKNPEVGRRLKAFVEGWVGANHEAVPGTSGISFRVNFRGESESLFVALTPDFFAFHRDSLRRRGIPEQLITGFYQALAALPCADAQKIATQSEPRLYLEDMSDEDVRGLLAAALHLVKEWRETTGGHTTA